MTTEKAKKTSKTTRARTWQQEQQIRFNQRFANIVGAEPLQYECYDTQAVQDLPFQRELADACVAHPEKFWSGALATGIGKSVIAARIAARYVGNGPVVYVSPSATSIGDLDDGVIKKFYGAFKLEGLDHASLGTRNDLSLANDVSFVTPWYLSHLLRKSRASTMKILRKVSCLIVDEAHRFPEDEDDELVVYGRIFEVAREVPGRVAVLTGTWHRLDQQRIMGLDLPASQISVQKAVNMGHCAQLYAVQVITKVAGKSQKTGELYDFHLPEAERKRYLDHVAAHVQKAHEMYPKPFAVFVRRVTDAEHIAKTFNRKTKLGARGMAVMTASTSKAERKRIVLGIQRGELVGYATCAVGEEAIDIPELSVVHLVRRTTSVVRNMQAIGRALRVQEGKKAIVVDYQTMVEGLKPHFVGLTIDDIKDALGVESDEPIGNGDVLVGRGAKIGKFVGMTMEEERALIIAQEKPVADVIPLREDPALVRERIEKRVDKVIGMVQARGGSIPDGWREQVIVKLMESVA